VSTKPLKFRPKEGWEAIYRQAAVKLIGEDNLSELIRRALKAYILNNGFRFVEQAESDVPGLHYYGKKYISRRDKRNACNWSTGQST